METERRELQVRVQRKPLLEKDRRANHRVDTSLTAIHSCRSGYFVEDEILDISRSGISVKTTEQLRIGDLVEVILSLPEGSQEVAIQAEVVRVKPFSPPPPSPPEVLAEGVTIEEIAEEDGMDHLNRPQYLEAGLYFCFVEPSHKEALQNFIEGQLRKAPEKTPKPNAPNPRIRVELDGPDGDQQAKHLQRISEKGLFIEVERPISIFSKPRVRLVNPLTQELYDIAGEVTQAQVLNLVSTEANPSPRRLYGIGVRFQELTAEDRQAISRIIACVGPDHLPVPGRDSSFGSNRAKEPIPFFRKTPTA